MLAQELGPRVSGLFAVCGIKAHGLNVLSLSSFAVMSLAWFAELIVFLRSFGSHTQRLCNYSNKKTLFTPSFIISTQNNLQKGSVSLALDREYYQYNVLITHSPNPILLQRLKRSQPGCAGRCVLCVHSLPGGKTRGSSQCQN